MRRLFLIVAVALCAWTPAQAASADTGSIAILSATGDYATASFTVTKTACGFPYYCGWFAIATRHLASQSCNTSTPIWVGASRDGLITATETQTNLYSFASDGPHRLCLHVYSGGAYTLLAEVVYTQDAPPPPPTPIPTPVPTPIPTPVAPVSPVPPVVTPPAATMNTTLMPSSVGRTDETTDRLAIFPAGAPWNVDSDRFVALVRGVAKRWDIYTGGVSWRTFRFARPDGRNAIGFATRPDGVLGTTSVWSARVYRPRRVCRGTASGRRCRTVGRYVGRQVVERDTALSLAVPWQQGPDYPGPDDFDLETVIIHELGHWAGNNHRRSCSNPMLAAIGAGDWWRDTTDHYFSGCGVKARIASVAGRLEHRRHTFDVHLPAGVPERAADAFAATAWAHRVATASEE